MGILPTIHSSDGLYSGLSALCPFRAMAQSRVSAASKSGMISGPISGDVASGRPAGLEVGASQCISPRGWVKRARRFGFAGAC